MAYVMDVNSNDVRSEEMPFCSLSAQAEVLASGHGVPMAGDKTAELLCAYVERHGIA